MGYDSVWSLAKPEIGVDTWQVDLPMDAQDAAACIEMTADALEARANYYRQAKVPEQLQKWADEAASRAKATAEAMDQFAGEADTWTASLDLPDFDRAG